MIFRVKTLVRNKLNEMCARDGTMRVSGPAHIQEVPGAMENQLG